MIKIRWVVFCVLSIIAVYCWLTPAVYWWNHSDESQMQIFKGHWGHYRGFRNRRTTGIQIIRNYQKP